MSEEAENVDPLESIARSAGWSPKEDWRGAEDGWKSAEDFVKDGVKIQAKQADKIDRMQGTISRVEENITKMAKGEAKRVRGALESQAKRLETERQEAFDEQDGEKFSKIDEELRETHKQINAEPELDVKAFEVGEKVFMEKNDWYGQNKTMTAFTLSVAQNLRTAFPDMGVEEYYEELEQGVKAQFPNQFRNGNRDQSGAVAGDNPGRSQGKKVEGFDSLPPEAKAAYQETLEYAPNLKQEEYAKSYYEMENK